MFKIFIKNEYVKIITYLLIFIILLTFPLFSYLKINNPEKLKILSQQITQEMLKQMISPSLIFSGFIINNQKPIKNIYNYLY